MNKNEIRAHFDNFASQRPGWFNRNRLYHDQIAAVCRQFCDRDSRVLELGCSTGQLLGALNAADGIGVDFSSASIDIARQMYPSMHWLCADVEELPTSDQLSQPFDLVIIEDLLGYLDDVQKFMESIKHLCHPRTRIVVSTWNWLWEPLLRLGEQLRVKAPDLYMRQNWLSAANVKGFLQLAGFETLNVQPGLLLPYSIPVLSKLINSLSYAPLLERLTLLTILVARPEPKATAEPYSVSVIIPTRNEKGNIQGLIDRMPQIAPEMELIFVDGNSTDGTIEEIRRVINDYPDWNIKYLPQVADVTQAEHVAPNLMLRLGKGDAVRKGFNAAQGEVLMILDSDVTVAPEDLPKFYWVLATKKADFANGTRFVYTQQFGAMQPINRLGNVFFSTVFSWLLGQRITDTLCGTKVLFKHDYQQIVANRERFGNFDPFGDFDLLFGAAWLGQRIVEVPVHYSARQYGKSKVRVSSHGPLLAQMSLIALWHFKLKPLVTGNRPQHMNSATDLPHSTPHNARRMMWLYVLGSAVIVFALRLFLRRKIK